MTARRVVPGPLSAFVLHAWDWSESSLIVDLFTRDRGRVVVVAKGAKRPTSQLRALLLPFQRLSVMLGRAPADEAAEVHPLRSAERLGGPPMPHGAGLFAAFYLNELVMRLLARQDAHPALFDAYASALDSLQVADEAGVQTVLRAFELTLLRETGVLPDLTTVTLTVQAVDPAREYTLHAESGLVPQRSGPGLSGSALRAAEQALRAADFEQLRLAVQPAVAGWRNPLREALHYHLGSNTLRTRDVMRELSRLADPRAPRA